MARVLSLSLPLWHVDLVRRRDRRGTPSHPPYQPSQPACAPRDERPRSRRARKSPPAVLLVSTSGQRQVVEHCCNAEVAAGVRPGMTLAHARALLPTDGVRVEPFRPRRDDAALRTLATWAIRFTPLAAPDPPDGLLLDISGCERLYGGEEPMVGRIAAAVAGLSLHARIAVAPTIGCAWAVARYSGRERAIVPADEMRRALAPLPVEALRIEPAAAAALAEIGVTTVEQLMALPRSSLPARFGSGLLRRLDQAIGTAPEFIDPVRPAEPAVAQWTLAGPTTDPKAVHLVVRELIGRLCAQLAARESGAQRLELDLRGPDMPPVLLTATLSRASRSPAHLWSLLRPQLERTHLADGIECFTLGAPRTCRLLHEQSQHWREGDSDGVDLAPAMGQLIDTLTSQLGAGRVLAMDPAESHRPDRVVHYRAILDVQGERRGRDLLAAVTDADRPSVLFDHPEPVNAIALAPDGAPRWLSWRGAEHHLTTGIGPERIGPEWWRGGGGREGEPTRDYFKVQDRAGLWIWVFHEPRESRWFVHGVWA